ncbi:hypothetical protein [Streptomyces sp. NPDC002845]
MLENIGRTSTCGDLVDVDDQGQVLIDPAPFDEQRTSRPAQVIGLRTGERAPSSVVMVRSELHVADESRRVSDAEDRQGLAALRDARHTCGRRPA